MQINILREQGFTDEECKRLAKAAMVLSEGLETETRSLLQKGEIHKVNTPSCKFVYFPAYQLFVSVCENECMESNLANSNLSL